MGRNEYLGCPLCGHDRLLINPRLGEIRFPGYAFDPKEFNVEETLMLRVREGGGKKPGESGKKGRGKAPGSGFHLVPEESLTLVEMMENPAYKGVLEHLGERITEIYNEFKRIGIIE